MKWPAESHPVAIEAYRQLFDRDPDRLLTVRYSNAFSEWGANVSMNMSAVRFALSASWQEVSPEIQTGLLQHLLTAVHRSPKSTPQMELYNSFVRHIGKYTQPTQIDSQLATLYNQINDEYFGGKLATPNLVWGAHSFRAFGRYDFLRHTITLSAVLQDRPDLLAYVLYHEMLHQKHSFSRRGKRTLYHSKLFRQDEKQWKDPYAETNLKALLRKKHSWFRF